MGEVNCKKEGLGVQAGVHMSREEAKEAVNTGSNIRDLLLLL